MYNYELEWGKWYRSQDRRAGYHPFVSYMLNKKWTKEEQFNNHMLRFQQVTVHSSNYFYGSKKVEGSRLVGHLSLLRGRRRGVCLAARQPAVLASWCGEKQSDPALDFKFAHHYPPYKLKPACRGERPQQTMFTGTVVTVSNTTNSNHGFGSRPNSARTVDPYAGLRPGAPGLQSG